MPQPGRRYREDGDTIAAINAQPPIVNDMREVEPDEDGGARDQRDRRRDARQAPPLLAELRRNGRLLEKAGFRVVRRHLPES